MRQSLRSALKLFGTSHSLRRRWSFRGLQPALRYKSSSADDANSSHPSNDPEHAVPTSHTPHYRDLRRFRLPRSTKVPIGVESLGEPTEIVVVPPRLRKVKDNSGGASFAPEDRISLASMLDDLEQENKVLSSDEIQRGFDQYQSLHRPHESLDPHHWEEMRFAMASSFAVHQLSDYLADYKLRNKSPEDEAARWRPGTSKFLVADPDTENSITRRVASSQGLTKKLLLVERIMRECWNLLITNEVGQLDLHLPPAFISLLMNAEHFSFNEVASLHRSTIDITHSLGFVRITGRQNDCESIREVILDTTSRIREREVRDIADITRANLSTQFLEWLSDAFGVAVEQVPPQALVRIFYLAENENRAEDARRVINFAIQESQRAPVPFSTYLPASLPVNVYKYNLGNNGSWFDRQKSWFRWIMPAVQTSAVEAPRTPLFDGHQSRLSDELLKLLRGGSSKSSTTLNGLALHESVTATVGKCAFAQRASLDNGPVSATQLGQLSLQRTFTTDLPRIMPFLDPLPWKNPEGVSNRHRIRLTSSSLRASRLPELDIEFNCTPAEISEEEPSPIDIKSVKLIRSTNSVDYLLPENSQDLRFTRSVYHEISLETLTESSRYTSLVENIRTLLSEVYLPNMTAEEPVSLPPFCQIEFPNDLLKEIGYESIGDSPTSDAEVVVPAAEKHTVAEYMFPPIGTTSGSAVRHYDFNGRELRYRSYESGPFFADVTKEVALDFDIVDKNSEEQDFHSFYNAACNMAFGIHKAHANSDLDLLDL